MAEVAARSLATNQSNRIVFRRHIWVGVILVRAFRRPARDRVQSQDGRMSGRHLIKILTSIDELRGWPSWIRIEPCA
jgi:hypothetical protein